jgi:hypothetical protein
MRRTLYATLLAAGLTSLSIMSALAQGYSGNYAGTYTASQLPGQQLQIGLFFRQLSQNRMMAGYLTSSGVGGICQGLVRGNVAALTCTNTTPTCRGVYRGRYTFTGNTVTWVYAGRDCLGNERGRGVAHKIGAP